MLHVSQIDNFFGLWLCIVIFGQLIVMIDSAIYIFRVIVYSASSGVTTNQQTRQEFRLQLKHV